MRVEDVFRRLKSMAERRHHEVRIVSEWLDRFVDGAGLDERFVALEIDDEVAVEGRSHFGDSVGARCVRRARKAHVAAEFSHRVGDAFIVGRDNHGVDVPGRSRAAVHVLNHRPARDISERLARKTGRRVAGRDDSDSMFMVLKEIADAF